MSYIPEAGDIIIIDFNPQRGHEMQKRRPALVVSNHAYSKITGMVMVCPITSTIRSYPLRVTLDARTATHGEIACDQLRSLDYIARGCVKAETVPDDILAASIDILKTIIGKYL